MTVYAITDNKQGLRLLIFKLLEDDFTVNFGTKIKIAIGPKTLQKPVAPSGER